jgi:hypothetical protein
VGSFNDQKVQAYIDRVMAANAQYLNNQLNYAYMEIRHQRETEDPKDDNRELAAAEHYMYARWQVASGESSQKMMQICALGYDPVKILGYVPVVLAVRKVVGYTYSRPSTDSIRWGLKGCKDGEMDKHRITPDPDWKPLQHPVVK